MKCPKCHSDNPDTKRFCGECGTQLLPAEEIAVSQTKTLEVPKGELTIGSTFASRYEVIEELGKGGMGSVYKVLDKEIDEEVALKLLNPEITADEKTIKRFKNELKLARKITHKNVCRMHDLGREGEIHYITMEYVPGDDLKSLIKSQGHLPEGKAISIAKQVCEGLAEAHKLGVVHRDLKPQNIMIDKKGKTSIMDFGIARSVEAKGVTEAGIIIGTPDYMSPEQVEGKGADQRSDIYSLGVILYEMTTGKVPFEGDTALSIAVKHKTETPAAPKEINSQIPEDLNLVILKCIEKDKQKRYQKAEQLLSELDKIEKGLPTTARVAIEEKPEIEEKIWQNSIAVLPFADLSPQKDQEYFCDGMAEELINSLTNIRDLRVVARTSAFAFKGKDMDVREVGEKLNVKTVLEGSIRKAGDRIRITAQLINVEDGFHLWSNRYDRDLDDVFAIQDEVSLAIAENLKIKLLGKEKKALVKRHTEDLDAYNLYLKGLHSYRGYTAKEYKKAIWYFEQALQKDPDYALPYWGLGAVLFGSSFWGDLPPRESSPKAKEYAKKALEIDKTLGIAQGLLGFISAFYDWNWKAAEQELKQALKLNPSSATSHLYYSYFLSVTERHEEAIIEARRVQELDPLSPAKNLLLGSALIWGSRYDEAIEVLRMTQKMKPDFPGSYFYLGLAYSGKSMFEQAVAESKKAVELSAGIPWWAMVFACGYNELGKKDQAEKLFESLKQRSKYEYMPPLIFFYYYRLVRGDKNKAFEWLKQACEEHDSLLPWCLAIPIELYRIPDEPPIKSMLKKYGLRE